MKRSSSFRRSCGCNRILRRRGKRWRIASRCGNNRGTRNYEIGAPAFRQAEIPGGVAKEGYRRNFLNETRELRPPLSPLFLRPVDLGTFSQYALNFVEGRRR